MAADHDSDRAELRHTIKCLRSYPDLARWALRPDGDPAHEKAVRDWRDHPFMSSVTRPWKEVPKLLDAAAAFLADEDDRLALVWQAATSGPLWGQLNQSDRDYYTVAHALAAEPGQRGGRRVQLTNRVALALIKSVTDHEYKSLGGITKARARLTDLGWISAEVGSPFTPGVRSRATVVDLLGVDNPSLRLRDCSQAQLSSPLPRPCLSDADREALDDAIRDSRRAKQGLPPEPQSLREQRRKAARAIAESTSEPDGGEGLEIGELRDRVRRNAEQIEELQRQVARLTGENDQIRAQVADVWVGDSGPRDWGAELLDK